MKTILVATDFSDTALNAVNYAADMAMAMNANLLLLHVYQIPVVYSEFALVANLEEMHLFVSKSIGELKEQLDREKNGKLQVETKITVGTFFYELNSICEKLNPYVVILGSQGKTAAKHALFGSHAVYAMKNLKRTMITVPPNASFTAIKKICLACDLSHVKSTIPDEEIKMLVNDFQAELHILNTGKQEDYDPEDVFASGVLQNMLAPVKAKLHFISHENTDESIMDFAEKNQIDLLIVLPKQHGLLHKILYKSHTKQFVLHSHVPVMALHQSSKKVIDT